MFKAGLAPILLLSFFLFACGGSSVGEGEADFDITGMLETETVEIGIGDGKDTHPEGTDIEIDQPDDAEPTDGEIQVDPDADVETDGCIGDPGCPCEQAGDCKSGLCIEDVNGQFCADTCLDDCGDDSFRCMLVMVGGEPAYFCIPRYVNLCRPCDSTEDCKADVGTDADLCVDVGPEGSFCGADCSGQACPEGYFCQTVSIPDGGTAKQCVPSGTECACTDKYVDFHANTTCYTENQHGTCFGNRYCSEEGLTDCDALTASEEICDDQDNDCDGETDEEISGSVCETVNVWGTCPGVIQCANGLEVCVGPEPAKEECDGLDTNCDGITDTEFPDISGDGIPDCLQDDPDEDGFNSNVDNCPTVYNPNQADYDDDNLGDACDPDDDEDGVNDDQDCEPLNADAYPGGPELCDGQDNNCNEQVDENFANIDGDDLADCIDPDDDNDGILDALDNCPKDYNPGQVNTDYPGDNQGDACDSDDDNDEIFDSVDNCPLVKNPGQENLTADFIGDACDPDDDKDGVMDETDNCPRVENPEQNDFDSDTLGDLCDPDIDGDGELNETDCDDFNALVNHFMDESCNGIDDNCKDGADEEGAQGCDTFYRDEDGDGFGTADNRCLCLPTGVFTAENNKDCNDDPAAGGLINPNMKEKCGNGVDDNCDGSQNDENADGCFFFYFDEDSDGYGINLSKCYCSPEGNYSADLQGDCNDAPITGVNINPGVFENCNTPYDDNCNDLSNEEDAINSVTFYRDEDVDGFGVTTDKKKLCSPDVPYLALEGGDCDDHNKLVNPSQPERCDAGKTDENCNDIIDEEDAIECVTYYFDGDKDNYGLLSEARCLCAPVGDYTATANERDCNDYNSAVNPGADEVCNGIDDDCDNQIDNSSIPVTQLCGDFDTSHATGACVFGECVLTDCSTGWNNTDDVFENGCECQDDGFEASNGDSCAAAVDVGELRDVAGGQALEIVANLPSLTDTDWFRVLAVDTPEAGDGGCDLFSFRAEFLENPSNAFTLTVYMGTDAQSSCSGASQVCDGDTSFTWFTDSREDGLNGEIIGECPCSNVRVNLPMPGPDPKGPDPKHGPVDQYHNCSIVSDGCDASASDAPKEKEPYGTVHEGAPATSDGGTPAINGCADDTRYFIVGVKRDPNADLTCNHYKLRLSNGVIKHH